MMQLIFDQNQENIHLKDEFQYHYTVEINLLNESKSLSLSLNLPKLRLGPIMFLFSVWGLPLMDLKGVQSFYVSDTKG